MYFRFIALALNNICWLVWSHTVLSLPRVGELIKSALSLSLWKYMKVLETIIKLYHFNYKIIKLPKAPADVFTIITHMFELWILGSNHINVGCKCNIQVWLSNPAWCRCFNIILTYCTVTTYFWMLCEVIGTLSFRFSPTF